MSDEISKSLFEDSLSVMLIIHPETGKMQIESYIEEHAEAEFSHSICPDCARRLYPELNQND